MTDTSADVPGRFYSPLMRVTRPGLGNASSVAGVPGRTVVNALAFRHA